MNFFEQQDVARRSTARLVVLFALAVLAIMASIEVLLAATMGYLGRDRVTGGIDWSGATDPQLLLVAIGGTLLVVGGGSLYKIAELRAGGRVVAEQLGGRLLLADAADPAERRLLNVVEEMAIASGTPTPPVYLLDAEDGINAFAAGFTPEDAVIGITRGAVSRLDRDELQGVIAHEFSHILNGDMRLNIRLMGLLHGILVIGMIGYFLLRVSFYGGGRRRSRDGNGTVPILALGAGLAVIGFAGTFFGNMIKAAVSRQREFLADASAVQFTRQPEGLAGALKKIGGFISGSSIRSPNAPEASHMFFGRATSGWSALFSTHPPLDDRIRRIDPGWDGEFPEAVLQVDAGEPVGRAAAAGVSSLAGGAARPVGANAGAGERPGVAGAVARVGRPDRAHLDYAAALIAHLPPAMADAARAPYGARAVIYALLVNREPEPRRVQLEHLARAADRGVYDETIRLLPLAGGLDPRARLPLVEIALPSLRALTPDQYRRFKANLVELVEADSRIDLFEWSLHRILLRDLEGPRTHGAEGRVRFRSIDAAARQCVQLLSTVAYVGAREASAAADAFERGARSLGLHGARLRRIDECGLGELDAALADLDLAAPDVKRRVLDAAVATITADRDVKAAEAELLRVISASMSCPMPPLVAA
jgi:Zn-dependent protease with chaperone function